MTKIFCLVLINGFVDIKKIIVLLQENNINLNLIVLRKVDYNFWFSYPRAILESPSIFRIFILLPLTSISLNFFNFLLIWIGFQGLFLDIRLSQFCLYLEQLLSYLGFLLLERYMLQDGQGLLEDLSLRFFLPIP